MDINESLRYLNIGLPEDILRKKMHGDFEGAIRMIDRRLQNPNLPEGMRQCMIAERHIMSISAEEYPYTFEEGLKMLQELLPDFTAEDLQDRIDDGRVRWIYVNGELRLIASFIDSLKGRDSALDVIAAQDPDLAEREKGRDALLFHIQKMKQEGSSALRITMRASIRLNDDQFTPGMFARVHLPIPADCLQQSDIVIERMFPEGGMIAPEDAEQRTVCWEKTMEENHEFFVEYSYTHKAVYHDLWNVTAEPKTYDFCVNEEEPHISFSPYIRHLAETLTEGVTDPLEKARRFYDFITCNMRYAYEPPYILLENISEHCAKTGMADCGVFALLFITLCRCAGVPARWQSGLVAGEHLCGCHDWAQFYVEPFGWLFADCSFGTSARWSKNEERRRFYFGNLDPCRMVANREFQRGFTVPKQQWRFDPYDNQSGEFETSDRGFRMRELTVSQEILSVQQL